MKILKIKIKPWMDEIFQSNEILQLWMKMLPTE
jgi:hypothetical protein